MNANEESALTKELIELEAKMSGELRWEESDKILYATDASVYRELPLAVALPHTNEDLQLLIAFATRNRSSLIPRTAGTSLAGQCVGDGIVVDVSKYFNHIIELNIGKKTIRVQPGVVRDELNHFLKEYGLFFSPITSTANRAMIGGMVGNNSCGTNSIVYGSTRDHVLSMDVILSDGSLATFGNIDRETFKRKSNQNNLEGKLYHEMALALHRKDTQEAIRNEFPKSSIHRRNTGYAVDYLLNSEIFSDSQDSFNFCKLLSGSEGTLAFTTEITLSLDPLPPAYDLVLAAHFSSIHESMRATQLVMTHRPFACELMDKIILDCTKENLEQRKNRDFIQGDPLAVLLIELRADTQLDAEAKAQAVIASLKEAGLGYHYPLIYPPHTKGVWQLRSAGLGLLANIPGDKKAVACIEDTAVALDDLPDYIEEFQGIMKSYGQESVYYAHAGAGEIHLRPILDLKKEDDRQDFYNISLSSAQLVKKYQGSLSGEHGDGRVRAPFLELMVGARNYKLFKQIKSTWDPNGIFNPGKIVDAAPMNTSLRYESEQADIEIDTVLDFSKDGGILRAAEKCNGTGDCRKLPLSGGTMCPSYQATRDEKDTTRGRANMLREFLTRSDKANQFDHEEIKSTMDLCLSCKGCTSECPSNVDMSSLKAEFLHQYYKKRGMPLRSKAFAHINKLNKIGSYAPGVYNFFLQNPLFSAIAKEILGVSSKRSLPSIGSISLRKWYNQNYNQLAPAQIQNGSVYLFCDEFTNWNDTDIGIKSIQLLQALGYHVIITTHEESGRAAISKGLLPHAQKVANKNVATFANLVTSETPLVGIEPSAILTFRDEYPRLVEANLRGSADRIKENTFLIEEFIASEIKKGKITPNQFTKQSKNIILHGHCHQKALSNIEDAVWMLSIPQNYNVELLSTGCCGMAGSFGYEREHYEVSQQVGELTLFPAVRTSEAGTLIAASGTSCRHQIADGTDRLALHPIEILYHAFFGE